MKTAAKRANIAFFGEKSDGRGEEGDRTIAECVGIVGGGGGVKESPSERVKAVMVLPLEGSSEGGREMITTP